MVREVEPATLEVVAQPLGGALGELQLRRLAKIPMETGIVGLRLRADRIQQRHKPALQLAEQLSDRRRRHAFVGIVDLRIGNVRIGSEELGIFAAEFERRFQQRHHAP